MSFEGQVSGSGIRGLGFRFQGLEFRVHGLGFKASKKNLSPCWWVLILEVIMLGMYHKGELHSRKYPKYISPDTVQTVCDEQSEF